MKLFHNEGRTAESGWVWVFGSNASGIHAVGDARTAKNNFGALYGVSEGRVGNSYAIPTRDRHLSNYSVVDLREKIETFFEHARSSPRERFFVTKIGCGPGGLPSELVAPMFLNAPVNCSFSNDWKPFLEPATVESA